MIRETVVDAVEKIEQALTDLRGHGYRDESGWIQLIVDQIREDL